MLLPPGATSPLPRAALGSPNCSIGPSARVPRYQVAYVKTSPSMKSQPPESISLATDGGAFGGARGNQPKPPEKGVFPLDHFGECKQVKEEYLDCLKAHQAAGEACQGVAKRYLECRMERNLMAKQDLATLGLSDADVKAAAAAAPGSGAAGKRKESTGFVAGTGRFEDSDK